MRACNVSPEIASRIDVELPDELSGHVSKRQCLHWRWRRRRSNGERVSLSREKVTINSDFSAHKQLKKKDLPANAGNKRSELRGRRRSLTIPSAPRINCGVVTHNIVKVSFFHYYFIIWISTHPQVLRQHDSATTPHLGPDHLIQ